MASKPVRAEPGCVSSSWVPTIEQCRWSWISIAVALFASVSAPAGAGLRYGVSLSGSEQAYLMGAVGTYLDEWARANTPPNTLGKGAVEEKGLHPGWTGAFRVMAPPFPAWLALEFTSFSGWEKILEEPVFTGDFTPYGSKADVSGRAYTATLAYLPLRWGAFRVGAGLGGGYYAATGDRETFVQGDGTTTHDWKAHGVGFHAMVIGEREWNQRWGVQVGLGYRNAKTGAIEEDGRTLRTASGDDVILDWNGGLASLGLFVDLGP